jgi:catechol 2,3-dioxygenase-like lactoylglutathione lyase family enzyme
MFTDQIDLMLYVRDIAKSVAFYRDTLEFDFKGWRSEDTNELASDWISAGRPGYAQVSIGKFHLSFHATTKKVNPGDFIIHIGVVDVNLFHQHVLRKLADAATPTDEPWGWRMFSIRDPDGYHLSFFTPHGEKHT